MIRIQVIKIGPIENNVFVVFDEETKNGVLIDCSDNSERILRVLSDLRVNIKYICLTHTHYDHILGLKGVMDGLKTGIVGGAKNGGFDLKRVPKIVIHKSEARYLLEGISNPRHFSDEKMDCFDEKDLFIFEGGEMICMEGIEIEVIHTPGHTVGGMCFLINKKHLFCGDLIFKEGLGRTDLDGGDAVVLRESVGVIKRMDKSILLYPGHEGFGFSIGERFYG